MTSEVRYGDDPLQSCDVYAPTVIDADRPLLVFVHGGLWVSRDKSDYAGVGARLAAHGFATAVVNYRLTREDNAVRPPDHVADLAAAIRALESDATAVVPLHRGLVLIGHSCGANMAAQLVLEATRFGVEQIAVRGVVGASGLYDLAQYCRDFPAWAPYLHVTWTADPARWESPQSMPFVDGERAPPIHWLVLHFASDSYVNETQARRWLEKLEAAEPRFVASARLAVLPGEHFEAVNSVALHNDADSPAAQLVDSIIEFLKNV